MLSNNGFECATTIIKIVSGINSNSDFVIIEDACLLV